MYMCVEFVNQALASNSTGELKQTDEQPEEYSSTLCALPNPQ